MDYTGLVPITPVRLIQTKEQRYEAAHYEQRQTPERKEQVKTAGRKRDLLRNPLRSQDRKENWHTKPFVMWDGEGIRVSEGVKQPYVLFGSSDGYSLQNESGLSTVDCLELILENKENNPNSIFFGFSFDYDVNQILADLSEKHLFILGRHGIVRWGNYEISHIPHKWFEITRLDPKGFVKIYDVFSFFNTRYDKVLEEYHIGTPEQRREITEGKEARENFTFEQIDFIRHYWAQELQLGIQLMDYLRAVFTRAGFTVKSWHGPAALSRTALLEHKIQDCLVRSDTQDRKFNPDVWLAARYAFSGGRFEQFKAGYHDGPVYCYDINSAYPYAMRYLPNLQAGSWEYVADVNRDEIDPTQYAIYHIEYHGRYKNDTPTFHNFFPQPLFCRYTNAIGWPDKVEGWYWSPEADLVKHDSLAKFKGAWIFRDAGDRPLSWIQEYFDIRLGYKEQEDACEYAFKLVLNSTFGQFAQRKGSERTGKAPRMHQIDWAGFITSTCKAMVYRPALHSFFDNGLVTVDTDGIYSTTPIPEDLFPTGFGKGLGQWEVKEHTGIMIWQNGFYWLRDSDGDWTKAKTRGAPRGTIDISSAWTALPNLDPIKIKKKGFIGYKQATTSRKYWPKWRTWRSDKEDPRCGPSGHVEDCECDLTTIVFGGTGKRAHAAQDARTSSPVARTCECNGDRTYQGLHRLIPYGTKAESIVRGMLNRIPHSTLHSLPWAEDNIDPWEMFDPNDPTAVLWADLDL